jgi:hypothetical protein
MPRWTIAALGLLLAVPHPGPACSLCGGDLRQKPTFREDAAQPTARIVFIGTVKETAVNPRDGSGSTVLSVKALLRSDPAFKGKNLVTVPRYLDPGDRKNPSQYLVFCDVFKGDLDPYRGVPLRSGDGADYVKKAMALDPRDRVNNLTFFFRYLEHPDKEIAQDAFLEFAKATDQEIGQVGPRLASAKLRSWLKDPQTPPERLAVYAQLLGACGGAEDAAFLRSLLNEAGERVTNAYDGILGGYIHLRPREGWDLALASLRDGRKPLPVRLAVVRTLQFYHGWQPKESRAHVLKGLEAMIVQGELADIAVEDLRQWKMWDLTREVLALYGKKGYDSPIVQRAIVRYALSCKGDNAAASFLADRRRQEPDLVKEVEESLQFEMK